MMQWQWNGEESFHDGTLFPTVASNNEIIRLPSSVGRFASVHPIDSEKMIGDIEEEIPYIEEKIGPYTFWLKVAEDDFNAEKKTLFATMVWHGARALSNYLADDVPQSIIGKNVLEFGAGAGLPSLVCRRLGSAIITASDYPAPTVISNLFENMIYNEQNKQSLQSDLSSDTDKGVTINDNEENTNDCKTQNKESQNEESQNKESQNEESQNKESQNERDFHVIEHTWGQDVTQLLAPLHGCLYDVVIASECLWKADTHEDFIISINNVLKPGGTLFLSFSHHIPGLEKNDLAFFDIIVKKSFSVVSIKPISVKHMWSEKLATVYIYELLKS